MADILRFDRILHILFIITLAIGISSSTLAQDSPIDFGSPKDFKIKKLDKTKMVVTFKLPIQNFTSKRFGVTQKKGKVYKNDELIGTYKMLNKLKLKSSDKNDYEIEFQIKLTEELNLMKEGLSLFTGKAPELKFTGKIRASWFILWKNYPFEYSQKLDLKNLIKL